MITSYWKTLMLVSAASLLALGCTQEAESRPLEPTPRVEKQPAKAAGQAPAAATDLAPAATPVAEKAPSEGAAAPAAAPAKLIADKPASALRGAASEASPRSGGQVITKKTYVVTITAPTATSGSEGSIELTLVPKSGRKINMEFPTKLTLVPPAGVTVAKAKLRKGDAATFSEKKAVFRVKYKAAAAGDLSFTGKFKFAVCTEATCDPMTEKLAFKVSVK